jgi:hypothetical protein
MSNINNDFNTDRAFGTLGNIYFTICPELNSGLSQDVPLALYTLKKIFFR